MVMVATAIYTVTMVLWKETAFPLIIIISNYSSCDVNVPIGLLRTRVPFSSCDVSAA